MEVQGSNQDSMVRLHAITAPGLDWTSLKEPCGAHPRKRFSFPEYMSNPSRPLKPGRSWPDPICLRQSTLILREGQDKMVELIM
jgi:hypothetical protein